MNFTYKVPTPHLPRPASPQSQIPSPKVDRRCAPEITEKLNMLKASLSRDIAAYITLINPVTNLILRYARLPVFVDPLPLPVNGVRKVQLHDLAAVDASVEEIVANGEGLGALKV